MLANHRVELSPMCHVLIIEDEAIAASDIEYVVRRAGGTSFAFADTERVAVEQAARRRPAVIVSDVMLADGYGPTAVQAIRTALGDIPVIFITAVPEEVEGVFNVSVIDKPFYPEQLAAAFIAVAPA
jgi:CheY-like chemotaxis protein